jgi:hypothetical protein
MKSALLIALVAFAYVTPALAQDRIELSAARDATACSISEPVSPPIVQIHVFVTGPVATTGVRFRVPKPACWVGATWLGDAIQPGMGAIGTSQTDWSVAFGACAPTPAYIGAVSYLISGQALPCCEVLVLPAGQFVFTDCAFREFALAEGTRVIVNPNGSCTCQNLTLAVQPTTWGRVKSLYR